MPRSQVLNFAVAPSFWMRIWGSVSGRRVGELWTTSPDLRPLLSLLAFNRVELKWGGLLQTQTSCWKEPTATTQQGWPPPWCGARIRASLHPQLCSRSTGRPGEKWVRKNRSLECPAPLPTCQHPRFSSSSQGTPSSLLLQHSLRAPTPTAPRAPPRASGREHSNSSYF